MTLIDMLQEGTSTKENYLDFFKKNNVSLYEILKIQHKKDGKSFLHFTASQHSLFSLALSFADVPFLEAFQEKYPNKLTHTENIYLLGSGSYQSKGSAHILINILSDYWKKSPNTRYPYNEKLEKVLLNIIDNEAFFLTSQYSLYNRDKTPNGLFKIAIENRNIFILNYFKDSVKNNVNFYSEYLFKKAKMDDINFFIDFFNVKTEMSYFNIENLESINYEIKKLTMSIASSNKKLNKELMGKIDFILCDEEKNKAIFSQVEEKALKLINQTDISKILKEDENLQYPMATAILKKNSDAINKLIEYGYKLNSEEKSLLLSNNLQDSINQKFSVDIKDEIDELAVLVKQFEKPLLKRLKTNFKNLKNFLESLSEDKKELLFSYYDQFQETHLSLYLQQKVDIININDSNISIIDLCLFQNHIEYVLLLNEHNFPFSNIQKQKIGELIFNFNSTSKPDFVADYNEILLKYKNFLESLSENILKTVFVKNSNKNIVTGADILDFFTDLVKDISLNPSEIDLAFNSKQNNYSLIWNILIHDYNDYFFNKASKDNLIKDVLFNNRDPYPKENSHVKMQILSYIMLLDIGFKQKLSHRFSTENMATAFSYYEKQVILQASKESVKNEVDKVRVRRRI